VTGNIHKLFTPQQLSDLFLPAFFTWCRAFLWVTVHLRCIVSRAIAHGGDERKC